MLLFRVPAAAAAAAAEARQGGAGAAAAAAGCAGAGAGTTTILHTGDFRWHAGMAAHPALRGRGVDILMLDTTYCQPRWSFPPQRDVVAALAARLAEEAAKEPATLFVVGSYHIGKERAYLGAARQLGWRVHAPPQKRKLLRVLGLPADWLELLTDCPEEAQVHVLAMGEQLQPEALEERLQGGRWQRVVAIRPTGWSYRPSGTLEERDQGSVKVLGVPYSEHSSFPELQDCVRTLRPKRLIPTVNADTPGKSRAIVDRFAALMDLSQDKSRLDHFLRRSPRPPHAVRPPGNGPRGGGAGGSAGAQAGGAAGSSGAEGAAEVPDASAAHAPAGAAGQQQQQQQQQQQPEAASGLDVDGDVDVGAIDVAEQRLLLAMIQRRSSTSASGPAHTTGTPPASGGGGRKRRPQGRGPGSAGGGGGLRQPSLKRFFSQGPSS